MAAGLPKENIMSRFLSLTMFILFSLSACAPKINPAAPSLPDQASAPQEEGPRLLQAETQYLGPLPTRTAVFESITPLAGCASSEGSQALFAPSVAISGHMLEVSACYRGRVENYAAFHIYLDVDNQQVGFAVNGLSAEWLVENDGLFRYQGNGKTWQWEFLAPVSSFDATAGEVSWSLPLSLLGASSGQMVLEVTDPAWNPLSRTAPLPFGSVSNK